MKRRITVCWRLCKDIVISTVIVLCWRKFCFTLTTVFITLSIRKSNSNFSFITQNCFVECTEIYVNLPVYTEHTACQYIFKLCHNFGINAKWKSLMTKFYSERRTDLINVGCKSVFFSRNSITGTPTTMNFHTKTWQFLPTYSFCIDNHAQRCELYHYWWIYDCVHGIRYLQAYSQPQLNLNGSFITWNILHFWLQKLNCWYKQKQKKIAKLKIPSRYIRVRECISNMRHSEVESRIGYRFMNAR